MGGKAPPVSLVPAAACGVRGGPHGQQELRRHARNDRVGAMSRTGVIVEWVLIFAALFSLWPWVFGYREPWYRLLLVVVLVAMLWVAARRIRRIR